MKLVVAGTGYVGLVTGVCLAKVGHSVVCVDVDERKIRLIKAGIATIYEPGLDELLKTSCEEGRLDFTSDYTSAYKDADVIFIGVGTPEKYDGSANLKFVYLVAKQIASSVQKDCIVILKSTVPIGTNDEIEDYIRHNLKHDVNIEVASNPEFLSQGTAVKDTLNASRIVLGVESKAAEVTLRRIYERFNRPIVVTNRRSAEMIKYASNDYLALKISFMNEIANLCELVGADVEEVALGMSFDSRIGEKFLKAGIGYGGSCFPKDVQALVRTADEYGHSLDILKAVEAVNYRQKEVLIKKIKSHYGDNLKGLKFGLWGLAFKPKTDDMREAPSLVVIENLLKEGASVIAFDPVAMEEAHRILGDSISYAKDEYDACIDVDALIIVTEWPEFRMPNFRVIEKLMKSKTIFDGRNIYEPDEMQEIKFNYYSIGRKPVIISK